MAVRHMDERKIVSAKPPVWHHLDQAALLHQTRLDDRRKVADSRPGDQRRREAGEVVHREVRQEGNCLARSCVRSSRLAPDRRSHLQAQYQRIVDGLRKAGVPEGDKKTD
jgi:hypothetical protein